MFSLIADLRPCAIMSLIENTYTYLNYLIPVEQMYLTRNKYVVLDQSVSKCFYPTWSFFRTVCKIFLSICFYKKQFKGLRKWVPTSLVKKLLVY